jgi:hypothetical protein
MQILHRAGHPVISGRAAVGRKYSNCAAHHQGMFLPIGGASGLDPSSAAAKIGREPAR